MEGPTTPVKSTHGTPSRSLSAPVKSTSTPNKPGYSPRPPLSPYSTPSSSSFSLFGGKPWRSWAWAASSLPLLSFFALALLAGGLVNQLNSLAGVDIVTVSDAEMTRVRVVGDVCGLGPMELRGIMAEAHGWRRDEPRYWHAGRWQTNVELYFAMEAARKRLPRDAMVCAMVAVHRQVPCLHAACVITVHLRPYYSDFSVLKQLVEMDEFGFIKHFRPRTVLDAGANVGYATLIFATFFPNATVVAIEASEKNYEVLQRNTYRLPNVYALHAGLFNHSGTVLLRNGTQTKTREGWQYVVTPVPSSSSSDTKEGDTYEEPQEGVESGVESSSNSTSSRGESTGGAEGGVTIRAVTVGDVLKQVGLTRFDFVKMDIEGSEAEVLALPPDAADAEGDLTAPRDPSSSSSSSSSDSDDSRSSSSASSSGASSTSASSSDDALYDPRPWLDEVRMLAVEVHDRMKPNCTVTVEAATVARQWRMLVRSGEYLVLENERGGISGRRGAASTE
ncbi:hypothetical protein CLOM_g24492 [Closterium sp. NIES-68]|nr:hypothetical protein CLOM_g24492 [Closterium sp. NIES-68]